MEISTQDKEVEESVHTLHHNQRSLHNKTKWEIVSTITTHPGRLPKQNVLLQAPGSTQYTKRSVTTTSEASLWLLIINEPMLKHINLCTESEARKQLEDH
ncbi:hypothetical protein PR048_028277 [Dryococelus australis]|uniref:Uncharacterized protein n=1 Tax=Dryococelus australis TaxID=614101 RepID=A0ABQ9GIS6_9NEOP|nr:hypothetical protein PR048_028277 [Dryococelus australis]